MGCVWSESLREKVRDEEQKVVPEGVLRDEAVVALRKGLRGGSSKGKVALRVGFVDENKGRAVITGPEEERNLGDMYMSLEGVKG